MTGIEKSEEELYLEIGEFLFKEMNALPKSKDEIITLTKGWIEQNNIYFKSKICGNDRISKIRKSGDMIELVSAVMAAIEASSLGSAVSPLAILLCKQGLNKLCDG